MSVGVKAITQDDPILEVLGVPVEIVGLGEALRAVRDALVSDGALDRRREETHRRRFIERFGPGALAELDGQDLLLTLHGRTGKDSLAHWLEFKNDDSFRASAFGSIGGGSALKFGIYQSAESETWMAGSGRVQRALAPEEAVDIALRQRDQLVAGAEVLRNLETATAAAVDFSILEDAMTERAPDVAATAWGHKYFSLLFPALVPPVHGAAYQRHLLIKLLKSPGRGRYENDGHFVRVAHSLEMSPVELAAVLHHEHGGPHEYWRLAIFADTGTEWPRMRDDGFVAIGWGDLGDLASLETGPAGKAALREMMAARTSAKVAGKHARAVYRFVHEVTERDLVVVMEGTTVVGIGRPEGEYHFEEDDGPLRHRRSVEWLSLDAWNLPRSEGSRSSFTRLGKQAENLVEIERHLLRRKSLGAAGKKVVSLKPPPPALPPVVRRIQHGLQRKGQVILYGPAGTGKTHWAERAAHELAARAWFRKMREDLVGREIDVLCRQAVEICTFHPAYGYEDFVERGHGTEARAGLFKELCNRARENSRLPYYLVVDEINRGDVPTIFGELVTVIERDKRRLGVTLSTGERWVIPDNVYLIGTMSTGPQNRTLDPALRRRFAFIELLPDSSALGGAAVKGLPLGSWLDGLNALIVAEGGPKARDLQIGQAYLMTAGQPVADVGRLAEIVRDEIVPLLAELCGGDYQALAGILGTTLIDTKRQRIHAALFEPENHDELIEALLAVVPGITATKAAVEATIAADAEAAGDDDEDEG